MLEVTVMMKAELGTEPGVSLGPSSKFSHTRKLTKGRSWERVTECICTDCQWESQNTDTISTLPSPNWAMPATTCWKEKTRKSQWLGTGSHSPQVNMHCSGPDLVWALHSHLNCGCQLSRGQLHEKWLPLTAWCDRLATPGTGLWAAPHLVLAPTPAFLS